MIIDIVSEGSVYGNITTFSLVRNKRGAYELSNRERRDNKNPMSKANMVYAETIEKVVELLETNQFNVVLTSKDFSIKRRVTRPLTACKIIRTVSV
ncbi:hypothetical protein [Vibrio hepatarius]|uniref:hypothetical protein n=1 Tax=Vibrio hepatarius TaxID=171383 RepID=UPI003736C3A6